MGNAGPAEHQNHQRRCRPLGPDRQRTAPCYCPRHPIPRSGLGRIAPQIASRRTGYYFDLVGYAQSQMRAGQDISLTVQSHVLAALFAEWSLYRPDMLAHDFGGATALRAYYLNGLRYASLTIFDAVALAPWGSPFVRHVREHETAFAGMPAYMHKALLRAYLQMSACNPLSEETLEFYSAPWLGPIGQAAFYRQIAQMDQRFTDEVEGLYAGLAAPSRFCGRKGTNGCPSRRARGWPP